MITFIAVVAVILISNAEICAISTFNNEYLEKKSTTTINGIFVLLVLFSHYSQYASLSGIYDEPYIAFKAHMGQMVVATFLFYSGFGMMESIRSKGKAYVTKMIPKTLKLLFRFDCAVILFFVLDLLFSIPYPPKRILLSLVGWDSVGNSNWYIFDILVLYVLIWVSFQIIAFIRKAGTEQINYLPENVLFLLFTMAFICSLIIVGKESWWYNTAILLPLGMIFSEYRQPVERIIMKNDFVYLVIATVVFGVYILSFLNKNDNLLIYEIWAISFTLGIILITMKIRLRSELFLWLGSHVFSIYILQRIPMIAMYKMGFIEHHKYMTLVAVILITAVMATAFDFITERLFLAIAKIFKVKGDMAH